MRPVIPLVIFLTATTSALGQADLPNLRSAHRTVIEGRAAVVRLATGFTTAVRVPEAVNSVVLGDPNLFQAEHSPDEPLFVFVKPISLEAAETNMLIVTANGRQFPLVLKSAGEGEADAQTDIDLLVVCRAAGSTLIEETRPLSLIAESLQLDPSSRANAPPSEDASDLDEPLDELLRHQQGRRLREPEDEGVQVSIGEVVPLGLELAVLFSVVNRTGHALELTPPQIQLAGGVEGGFLRRRTRWTTIQQIPVSQYQLTRRRLGPGERSDGIVVFERPAIKQSNENLLLQIAQTGAIDQPVLVRVGWY